MPGASPLSAPPPADARDAADRRAATGVPGLDRILGGGLPAGESYLLHGAPGTGKTVLGLHFLLEGARRGETGLFFSVTQRLADIARSARSHGWTLDPPTGAAPGGRLVVHQLATAAGDPAGQVLFRTADVELGEVLREVTAVLDRVRPTRIVFDAVAELRFLARDPVRFERELFALRALFDASGATVLLTDGRQGPMDGVEGGELAHIAHGVLALEHAPTELGTDVRRLRVVKVRGLAYREGYHDFRITDAGLVVHPRIAPDDVQDVAGARGTAPGTEDAGAPLSSGVASLDALLGGGLAAGTSCLIVGPSGTGKSTTATVYACAAAARGQRSALFLFEERPATVLRRSDGLGLPLREHVTSGCVALTPVSTGQLTPGEFADAVRRQVTERGVELVVIDSLTGYLSAMGNARLLMTQLHDLLQYLSAHGVLTLLVVAQHGVLGSALGGPVDASYLADAVLVLRHFEADGVVRKAVSVFKKRYGAHESHIRELTIGAPEGVRVGAPLRGFRGLLTGTPEFTGDARVLGAVAEPVVVAVRDATRDATRDVETAWGAPNGPAPGAG